MFGGASNQDPWQNAANMARSIAAEGQSEPNVDPKDRKAIEDLSRVAELQVKEAIHFDLPSSIKIDVVTRGDWSEQSLKHYRPLFEQFGNAMGNIEMGEQAQSDPMSAMLNQMMQGLGPSLVATSAASMIGHLGSKATGQYDLPIPRQTDTILVVPQTLNTLAEQWSVPVEELQLWILLKEYLTHGVLSIPHVQARLESLLLDFASAFKMDTEVIGDQFGSIGSLSDMRELEQLSDQFSSPDAVLSMMRTGAHDLLMPQLDALVAIVIGYVSHTMDTIGETLLPNHKTITNNFYMRWMSDNPADRFMEQLLGLELNENTIVRGNSFIKGIVERAGQAGIEKLWADELDMPTAAEVDAPGLWLARVNFSTDQNAEAKPDAFEVPDDLSGLDDLE